MPTQTQPWLRAELIAAPETTPGAQLMIPADGVEFHDDQLVFHHQGDIVYVASQGQLRSITWFARQPNPETARRKAQWPKHGTRWTDEERADLLRHLRTGQSWKAISHAHGRSRTGCQQEAIKQGWLDPDTLQPTAALLLAEPDPTPAAKAESLLATPSTDSAAPTPDATPADSPDPAPNNSSDPKPNAVPAGLANKSRKTAPTDSPPNAAATPAIADQLHKATLADAAADSPANPAASSALADLLRETALASAAADSPPNAAASASSPPSARPAASPALANLLRKSAPADTAADSPPNAAASASSPPTSWVIAPPPAADPPQPSARIPASTRPSPSATSSPTAELAVATPRAVHDSAASPSPTTPSAPPIAAEPLASATAAPQPDRPRIPPRVPRQRTGSGAESQPGGGDPDKDPDPDSGPGSAPGPGSRFLSRAQSSLARATLGAYMNPPRGQSGAASGAT
ncbi:hypothetical protein ABH926_001680 [Catenulispora sp. GP43]|uniref:hypothetical protein n=1 Tax=Catenulispora sp. GP43 TaxID=3156263 RepID=UPI003512C39D